MFVFQVRPQALLPQRIIRPSLTVLVLLAALLAVLLLLLLLLPPLPLLLPRRLRPPTLTRLGRVSLRRKERMMALILNCFFHASLNFALITL